jgi:putative peptide zinc metalloprotease protein
MKKDYLNSIVTKNKDLEIQPFNDINGQYLITIKSINNRVVVNQKTKDFIDTIDNESSLYKIINNFNTKYNQSLDQSTAIKLTFDKLLSEGIILLQGYEYRKKKASYLFLSFNLFSQKFLQNVAKVFSHFIKIKYFYLILLLNLLFILLVTISNVAKLYSNVSLYGFSDFIFYFIVTGIILIFHEFGHATASFLVGSKPNSIGFGFYLLTPVMFTDVSDLWRLNKKKRNYVNFAGIYFEVLIGFLTSIFFLITDNIFFLIVNSIILFRVLINLNPFFRYDGYWILSDSIGIPNLRKESNMQLKLFLKYILKGSKFNFTLKNIFLSLYSLISISFIFIFLTYIVIFNHNSLISFPIDLYYYILSLLQNESNFKFLDLLRFLIPSIFYFVVLKFIILFIVRKLNHKITRR